jgi:hypothetical protein
MNNSDIDKLLGKNGISDSSKFNLLGIICALGFVSALATAGFLLHPSLGWAGISFALYSMTYVCFECGKAEDQ